MTIPKRIAVVLLALSAALANRTLHARGDRQRPEQTWLEGSSDRERRMQWWREARFGMFVHWGLYAVPAGEFEGHRSKEIGEWIMSWANIPRARYEQFAARFDPVGFDAAEWVRTAKNAGMKYIVITSKHHDGFSMFDSATSPYDIVDATPYKKDPMRALADETKKQGLRFCFYYSIMDWHHPSQYVDAAGKDPTAGDHQTKMRDGRKSEYIAYMKAQLRELVTSYDPAVLWFDGEWVDWWSEDDGRDLYRYVRGLKSDIIINNRVGKGRQGMQGFNRQDREYSGDFGTPEQQIPPSGLPGVDWESCMTMNDTWGYKSYDDNWKPAQTLIRNLVDTSSKGGNYLLNVGPMADGRIPAPSVERLAAMGRWMSVNGEAIYGTGPSPFAAELPFGRATSKPGRIYLHVFDWPADGTLKLPRPAQRIEKAYLLASRATALKIDDGADGVAVHLPATAPDPNVSVVVLETAPAGRSPRNVTEFEQLFHEVSNWGRWGKDDQLGAVNLITPDKRKQALALARTGITVPLAHTLMTERADDNSSPFEHTMNPPGFNLDTYRVSYHGYAHSHIDALCHFLYKDQTYNGYSRAEVNTSAGCTKLGIDNLRNGVITRAVLVDAARLKGVAALEPGTPIYVEDLEAWEKRAGVRLGPGDALLVRTGRWARRAATGPWNVSQGAAGLHASVAPWIKKRGIAIVGSDVGEDVIPSMVEGVTLPVHALLITAMGINLLDNQDLEAVADTAARLNRWEFMLTFAPLVVRGGTGSPLNALAVF
jgi:alpha-L-fucosidase